MPEGHTVHRVANEFSNHFVNREVIISSPQGRFASDAKLVSGQVLRSATAVGKQLFLSFEDAVVRIHLGIYGKWTFGDFIEEPPTPTGQVRARFLTGTRFADLRGPTACEVLGQIEAKLISDTLGPDPLNPDPDNRQIDRFLKAVQKSSQGIGLLLMNQQVVAGVGNVYRAELLFRAGINPHTPSNKLSPEAIQSLWLDAKHLMRFGVDTGVMVTRDELLGKVPDLVDRYFVYKREGLPCRNCGNPIALEILASRKLYWCTLCQR